jgi:PAS domain S-box-containing protein
MNESREFDVFTDANYNSAACAVGPGIHLQTSANMKLPLHVLIVEDSEDDTIVLIRELRHAQFDPFFEQVSSPAAMEAALRKQSWDLIISDHSLPGFSSFDALEMTKTLQPGIPFIVVSGVIGEEIAVTAMKAGASDYVMKNNLARLAPSIERELREAKNRRAAHEARAYLAAIVQSSEDAIIGKTLDGVILTWNAGAEAMYGYTAAEVKGRSSSVLVPPNRPDELPEFYDKIRRGERIAKYETVRIQKNGTRLDVSLALSPIKDADGKIIGVSAIERDITARKREEEVRVKLIQELSDALANIKTLKGLLPICSACKKIRDDHGYWKKVESYISEHTGAEFTHGICPDCLRELYPGYAVKE